jgi:hypothetical protein
MKIEKLSAWAEIIASAAILVTLVYLAVQTRQNSQAIKASTRQQMLVADMGFLTSIYDDPGIVELQYQTDLTDEEKAKLAAQYTMYLRLRENNWIQFKNGALDELTWESMKSTFSVNAHQPNFQLFWKNREGIGYAPEFVKIVDEIVANTPVGDQALFVKMLTRRGEEEVASAHPLAWIAGCWQSEDGATREVWRAAADTHLFGHSVSTKGGEVSFFEHLRIAKNQDAGGYTLSAYPSGVGPSDFASASVDEHHISFENPAHDYPQKITYTREGNRMTGIISLVDGTNSNVWNYVRCGG